MFGLPLTRTPPVAAALTKDHPPKPESGYALAKSMCEEMALRNMIAESEGLTPSFLAATLSYPNGGHCADCYC